MYEQKSKMECYRKLIRDEKNSTSLCAHSLIAAAFSALRISQVIKTFFRQPLFLIMRRQTFPKGKKNPSSIFTSSSGAVLACMCEL